MAKKTSTMNVKVLEGRKNMMQAFGVKNPYAVPTVKKIIVNAGIGSFASGGKDFSTVVENITAITGQKPVVKKSRKAISNFQLKMGQPVGVMVTLRGRRMNDFLRKVATVVLPRIRDFRGISPKAFDGKGNYSLGLREISVFTEVNPDSIIRNHGVEITIVTSAGTNAKALTLLKGYGFPFKSDERSPAMAGTKPLPAERI